MQKKDKVKLIPYIEYLQKELKFLLEYEKNVDWKVYNSQRDKRLEIERWVDVINATLDISKMLLTIKGEILPETSREVLFKIGSYFFNKEEDAIFFSELAKIRNTLAHRYLDLRWEEIKRFFKIAHKLYPSFLEYIKKEVE